MENLSEARSFLLYNSPFSDLCTKSMHSHKFLKNWMGSMWKVSVPEWVELHIYASQADPGTSEKQQCSEALCFSIVTYYPKGMAGHQESCEYSEKVILGGPRMWLHHMPETILQEKTTKGFWKLRCSDSVSHKTYSLSREVTRGKGGNGREGKLCK